MREIHSGGVDTHNLAVAAAQQAVHSEEIADAANSFSETADAAAEEFRKAAADSAAASKQAAANAERTIRNAQESFRQDQRAWVGLDGYNLIQFDANNLLKADIRFLNSGRTPALHVQSAVSFITSPTLVDGPPQGTIKDLNFEGNSSLPPQGKTIINAIANTPGAKADGLSIKEYFSKNYELLRTKRGYFFVFGELRYHDVSSEITHHTEWCFYLRDAAERTEPANWQLSYCKTFWNMD